MTSENDAEFVEIMMQDGDWQPGSRMHRLAVLARRGAEAADRIEQLEAALRWIDEQRYVDRSTINQDNAFRKAVSLNERLVKIMDTARAELEKRT
jgi:hypothetical protein